MKLYMFRALLGIPSWLFYILTVVPLMLLAFLLVPVAAMLKATTTRPSEYTGYNGRQVLAWTADWMWLWGNEEDGIDGSANNFQQPSTSYWGHVLQIIKWSTWRNKLGNDRWTKLLGMTVDPLKVHIVGMDLVNGPYVANQGWRFEVRFPWSKTKQFRLGWGMTTNRAGSVGVGFGFEPWTG
ncbi:MAG: DUF7338 family protein [Candidatus Dormibacteria bacterium]